MRRSLEHALVSCAGVVALLTATATEARAHCDTMNGPVVKAARQALATGNVNHVLPWVRQQDEDAIRTAFHRARTVRVQGTAAGELADYWFFETLVRIHREGEGAPYTGLKPAGAEEHSAVAAADHALAVGKVEEVERVLLHAVRDGLRERFQSALAKKPTDVNDVARGREYIRAYVQLLHYVEWVYDAAHAASAPEAEHASHAPSGGEPR